MNASQDLIQQLLSQCPGTREKGWEFIYKRYYPMIQNMVLKNGGCENDSVDIFQDGLLILNRNLTNGTFRNESALHTYIFSICRNLWFKEYKKRQKRTFLGEEITFAMSECDDYLANAEIVGLLLNELQEDCRKILKEYYFNNRSMAELKEMFNVNSIQATKNKKWRCLKHLVKLFKDRGITPTS